MSYNATSGNIETITAPDSGTLTFAYDGSLLLKRGRVLNYQ